MMGFGPITESGLGGRPMELERVLDIWEQRPLANRQGPTLRFAVSPDTA